MADWRQPGPPPPVAVPVPWPDHRLPVPARSDGLPREPRDYHQLLRGPRHRWWRPLVSLLLVVALGVPLLFAPILVGVVVEGAADGLGWLPGASPDPEADGPVDLLFGNLGLAMLIVAAGLAVWLAHRVRPGYLSSVAGRLRWRWLGRCVVVVTPIWLVYLAVGVALDPTSSPPPALWGALLAITVVTTPLQAAAEEYLFRGWVMQSVGSWFARPAIGLLVSTAVSAVLFSLAHGSLDPGVLAVLTVTAVSCCLLTWFTGGLEAAIVLHAANNVLLSCLLLGFGGWEEAYADADTTASLVDVLIEVVAGAAVLAAVWWQARRTGLDRRSRPALPGPVRTSLAPPVPGSAGWPA